MLSFYTEHWHRVPDDGNSVPNADLHTRQGPHMTHTIELACNVSSKWYCVFSIKPSNLNVDDIAQIFLIVHFTNTNSCSKRYHARSRE